ncbi:MAG: hypothetical protein ACFFC7_34700 [Candidatus Hermodarchaeota archaeon]
MWKNYPNIFEKTLSKLKLELDINFCSLYPPWYLAGNWEDSSGKLLIVGLNPGVPRDDSWNQWLTKKTGFDKRNNLSWDNHKKFALNCFQIAYKEKKRHRHYTTLAKLVYSFYGEDPPSNNFKRYEFLNEKSVFCEMIPFYSDETKPKNQSVIADVIYSFYWAQLNEFISERRFDKVIIMNKQSFDFEILYKLMNVDPQNDRIGIELYPGELTFCFKINIGRTNGLITPF